MSDSDNRVSDNNKVKQEVDELVAPIIGQDKIDKIDRITKIATSSTALISYAVVLTSGIIALVKDFIVATFY